jgi:hypothetical protein
MYFSDKKLATILISFNAYNEGKNTRLLPSRCLYQPAAFSPLLGHYISL